MEEELTEKLLEELINTPDPATFVYNHNIADAKSLPEYLQELLTEKRLERKAVVREAQIVGPYGWQIFAGIRTPSRDYVLRLSLAMKCSLRETSRLLQAAGHNNLYPKVRRDAIIIMAIERGMSLQETEELLYEYNENTLIKAD